MENQTGIEQDWRNDINQSVYPKLKIQESEIKKFIFLDEGKRYKHPDYKPCIVFTVQIIGQGEDKYTWFVNQEAYGLLGQIKALGKLTGLAVEVKRTGMKKSDTRYDIKKIAR
jgi:hypothetical protein